MSIKLPKGCTKKGGLLDVRNISFGKSRSDMNLTSLSELGNVSELLNGVNLLLCNANNLTSLPELPEGIIEIYCNHNKLISLPELPNSLSKLFCYHNNLTSLPELPDGLERLDCENNEIKYLPKLPDSLDVLFCHDNPLECLVPSRFIIIQNSDWLMEYYHPYISSYAGQRNILSREPWMIDDLVNQVKLLDDIKKEFSHLINGYELNLI